MAERLRRRARWLFDGVAGRDPVARQEARHTLLVRLAERSGFRIYNKDLLWHDDPEFLAAWRDFPESTPSIHDRKFTLLSIARSLRGLPGDSAECGVFAGGSSYLMCNALDGRPGAEHHLFDSFEGLSTPEEVDRPQEAGARGWAVGDLAVAEERAAANLARFDFVRFHRGWIPDRFEDVADRVFCLVHVDVDLYQPTRDSLEFFYPRLVEGGMIVCDDYGFTTCPGATRACDEYAAGTPQGRMIHLTTGQGLLIKRGAGPAA